MGRYTHWDMVDAAETLKTALEARHFSLVVPPTLSPTALAEVVAKYKVGKVFDLSPNKTVEEALLARELGLTRIAAYGSALYLDDFGKGRLDLQLIKLLGSVDHPDTIPPASELEYAYQLHPNLEAIVSSALSSTTVVFIEVRPSEPGFARILLSVLRNIGRHARSHVLILRQGDFEEMGQDFGLYAAGLRKSYNVQTLVVPDDTGTRLLLEGE